MVVILQFFSVLDAMKCIKCNSTCVIRFGRSAIGKQCYKCQKCGKRFLEDYSNKSWQVSDRILVLHLIEGLSLVSISRLLRISQTTVITRIKQIAKGTTRPFAIVTGKEYEIDELRTFVGSKKRKIWITYAIRKDTGEVVDFVVGSRSKTTMSRVTQTVILSKPRRVYTDRYKNYKVLVPAAIHRTRKACINKIERNNVELRKDLKRLGRKTICFSKSLLMLIACLRIYFWAGV